MHASRISDWTGQGSCRTNSSSSFKGHVSHAACCWPPFHMRTCLYIYTHTHTSKHSRRHDCTRHVSSSLASKPQYSVSNATTFLSTSPLNLNRCGNPHKVGQASASQCGHARICKNLPPACQARPSSSLCLSLPRVTSVYQFPSDSFHQICTPRTSMTAAVC